ncbi:hypothetical protein AQUCO_00500325v1 [Aquilegia coerulea]|uniref:Myb-like domain-containing protein n=1 Tax=Aquilegia coerulea TaxID=218851 RepID=A0A2G5ERF4_AQUCA|nr:hypothetical protein AQUCO_00500325v1 [Aquilegia coerulea]
MTLTNISDEISPFPDAGNLLYGERSSFPTQKLLPIRSNGDEDSSSPTNLASGSSSPHIVTSNEDSNMEMEIDGNPSSASNKGPLWEIVAKKLEQMGYEYPKDNIFSQLLAFGNRNNNNDDGSEKQMSEENGSVQAQAQPSVPPDPIDIANMLVALHTTSAEFQENEESNRENKGESGEEGIVDVLKRKRKRRNYSEIELVLLSMVDRLMKKQEEMHKQLLDLIDKQEKERIAREEAWREQELERHKKEREVRDRETSRNVALISYIGKFLGKQIEVPKLPQPPRLDESQYQAQDKLRSSAQKVQLIHIPVSPHPGVQQSQHPGEHQSPHPGVHQSPHPSVRQPPHLGEHQSPHPGEHQSPHPSVHQFQHPGQHQSPHPGEHQSPRPGEHQSPRPGEHQDEAENRLGSTAKMVEPVQSLQYPETPYPDDCQDQAEYKLALRSNRWPEPEVKALISIRTGIAHKFQTSELKQSVWEEISGTMSSMGFNRSAKKCKEKWENINKYFKKSVASGQQRRRSKKTCPYFDELHVLYQNGSLNFKTPFEVRMEGEAFENRELQACNQLAVTLVPDIVPSSTPADFSEGIRSSLPPKVS